jgi:hypothetical protein
VVQTTKTKIKKIKTNKRSYKKHQEKKSVEGPGRQKFPNTSEYPASLSTNKELYVHVLTYTKKLPLTYNTM